MKPYLSIVGLCLMAAFGSSLGNSDNIRLNQVGYYPNQKKIAVIVNSSDSVFDIIDESGAVSFSGDLIEGGYYIESDEQTMLADFSDFSNEGVYRLVVSGDTSFSFEIAAGLFDKVGVKKHALKTFYFQRASMAITSPYGERWTREMGHEDEWLDFYLNWRSGRKDSPGGWYDAGDYGKYIVNGGITVGTLLGLYEIDNDVYPDGYLNIPESSNGKSDILDEVKYELDWFLTMQDETDPDEAQEVSHKLGPDEWPWDWAPDEDITERFISEKSTPATLNFAAVMAMAGRIYEKYDNAYASQCLKAAESAWNWAVANDNIGAPSGPEGSGGYGDKNFDDEFFWAASELFITTGKDVYKSFVIEKMSDDTIKGPASWPNVGNLGYYSLAVTDNSLEQEYKNKAKQLIVNFADSVIQKINNDPYRCPMDSNYYHWGSNGNVANFGIVCAYAWYLTGESKYFDGLTMTCDYLFGKNATTYSFVTGYGEKAALDPHHRPSGADNVEEPVPGFLVGGPNKGRQDSSKVSYTSHLPALSYEDVYDSYASNEVAINWSAPFVFVTAFIDEVASGKLNPVSVKSPSNRGYSGVKSKLFDITTTAHNWRVNINKPIQLKQLSIYDSRGRLVKIVPVSDLNKRTFLIPSKGLTKGWYFVSFDMMNHRSYILQVSNIR